MGEVRNTSRISAILLLIPLVILFGIAPSQAAQLGVPSDITVSPLSSTSIRVNFGFPTGSVASYTVFVFDTADGDSAQPIRTVTSYSRRSSISGLATNKTYKVKMQTIASAPDTNSELSDFSNAVTLGGTLATPSAPTVTATANTLKSISVSWTEVTNASSYTLKLYSASNTLLATTGLTRFVGTSRTITTANYAPLANNTSYKVSITAIGAGSGDSAESARSDVTTNALPQLPTITVQPTNQSSTFASTATFGVTATTPDSGTLGYQWQVSTNSGDSWSNVSSGTGGTTSFYTTATLAMAANGYQYRVNVTNAKNGATSSDVTSSSVTLTVAKADQGPLTSPVLSATTAAYNGSAYSQTLTVTSVGGGSSTGAPSITGVDDGTATGCSFSAGTLTASSAGTCTLTVIKAGDANYNAVSTTATFIFTKANQATLSFTLSTTSASGNGTSFSQVLTMTPSGGAGNGATTYAIATGGTASLCALANDTASNTITATSVGTCLIQATKASDNNHNSTSSSTVTFTFTQTISTDNNLGSLAISPGTTTPVFSSATTSYSVSISSTVQTLTFTAAPESQYATMTLNGSTLSPNTPTTVAVDVTSTTQVITIRVTAEDLNTTTKDYLISVTRVVTDKTSEVLAPNVTPTPSPVKSTTQRLQTPSSTVLPRINASGGLSLTSGPVGQTIIINGTGFNSLLSVKMNGLRITPNSTSSTSISLTIPTGARSGTFVVTTTKGSVSTPRFTVTAGL